MIYRVTNIQEDIDFGCEERAEGTPVMAVVTFEGENGQKMVKKIPDAYVYDEGIEVDSEVVFDTNGMPKKKLSNNWTKECSPQNTDIKKFTDMMMKVKNSAKIDWNCPFCGGKVSRLEQEGNHTVIGCESCDMRIKLDN